MFGEHGVSLAHVPVLPGITTALVSIVFIIPTARILHDLSTTTM